MKNILIYLIGKYQKHISPHLQRSGVHCIYNTSCSNYTVESLNAHPLPKAILLSTYRFASCNPVTAYLGQRKYKQLATLTATQEAGTEEKIKELQEEIKKLKPIKKTSKGTWGCLAVGCVLVVIFVIWNSQQPTSNTAPSNPTSNNRTSCDSVTKATATTVNFKALDKNPDSFQGRIVKFTGQVLQIQESGNQGMIRLAVTKESYGWSLNDIVYIDYNQSTNVLQDDIVTVYGVITGAKTYTSRANYKITIPGMLGCLIEKNY